MKWLRRTLVAIGALLLALTVAALAIGFPPSWGAGAILHPTRRPVGPPPALPHRDVVVESGDVTLKGWLFPAEGTPRGITVVYLHGSADNRDSGNWIAERLVPKMRWVSAGRSWSGARSAPRSRFRRLPKIHG